jgi:hypothetical protein
MNKPCRPGDHRRYSKCPTSISEGSTSHNILSNTSYCLCIDRCHSCPSLATTFLIVLEGNEPMCSFKCPYVGKPIGIRHGNRGHAHGLPRPIHGSRFVAFSNCQTTSSRCAGVVSCLKHLCLRAGGRSSRIPFKNSHIIKISLCS